MLTRYQAKATLYASVLENPLVASRVVSYLSAKDVVHLMLTSKSGFAGEARFKDVVAEHMRLELPKHEERALARAKAARRERFCQEMKRLHEAVPRPLDQKLRCFNSIFQCVVDHKDMLFSEPVFDTMLHSIERKLIEFVEHPEYVHNALHYLGEIFDIRVWARADPGGEGDEYIEYITDRSGRMIMV